MNRKFLAMLAVASSALISAAYAQAPDGSGGTSALSMDDRRFYTSVAQQTVGGARLDGDVSWSASGRAGTIRFSTGAGGCKSFFIAETQPARKPSAIGDVCPSAGQMGAYYVLNLRNAAAAGPGGEPRDVAENRIGATRGLTAPPSPPPPPPPPPPPAYRDLSPPPAQGATRGLTPPGAANGGGQTRGLTAPAQPSAVTARFVPLMRNQERIARAGGHGVVLMRNLSSAAGRNQALCTALDRKFDDATYAQTEVGVVRQADGTLARVRPIYWPTDNRIAPGAGTGCTVKMRQYDYGRANAIMDKMGLSNSGPYLVVSRDNQLQAATIDMTGLSGAQIPKMVDYFSDSFSQTDNIWSGSVNTVQMRSRSLAQIFQNDFTESLVRTISLFQPTSTMGGCVGDPTDTVACRR